MTQPEKVPLEELEALVAAVNVGIESITCGVPKYDYNAYRRLEELLPQLKELIRSKDLYLTDPFTSWAIMNSNFTVSKNPLRLRQTALDLQDYLRSHQNDLVLMVVTEKSNPLYDEAKRALDHLEWQKTHPEEAAKAAEVPPPTSEAEAKAREQFHQAQKDYWTEERKKQHQEAKILKPGSIKIYLSIIENEGLAVELLHKLEFPDADIALEMPGNQNCKFKVWYPNLPLECWKQLELQKVIAEHTDKPLGELSEIMVREAKDVEISDAERERYLQLNRETIARIIPKVKSYVSSLQEGENFSPPSMSSGLCSAMIEREKAIKAELIASKDLVLRLETGKEIYAAVIERNPTSSKINPFLFGLGEMTRSFGIDAIKTVTAQVGMPYLETSIMYHLRQAHGAFQGYAVGEEVRGIEIVAGREAATRRLAELTGNSTVASAGTVQEIYHLFRNTKMPALPKV